MNLKSSPKGFAPIYLIGIILVLIAVIIFVINQLGLFSGVGPKKTETTTQQTPTPLAQVDKSDPKWLEKYCREEMAKLPEAPFKLESKKDTYLTMADTYILKRIPEEKRYSGEETCQIDYNFKDEIAYPSVGVEYKFDIKNANMFREKVDQMITTKMASSWKKISPLSAEEAGRPFYLYEGIPVVFTRENPTTGTVDYAYFDFGALVLYASFTTYEK